MEYNDVKEISSRRPDVACLHLGLPICEHLAVLSTGARAGAPVAQATQEISPSHSA
jgi:hypothetical protein